jgi:hypothetical protein
MIESISQLGLAFFGLTTDTILQSRTAIFKQIHQIVFHGNGGYDWHTVYNMPIWLRRFTFNEIKKHFEEENESIQKQSRGKNSNSKTVIDSDGKVKLPNLLQKPTNSKKPVKYG